jgi:signal transduction histidine kinase
MQKLPFTVSARTAKLIGQENFSNPEGAIMELVKNCYDADANNCLIIFDIAFENIPVNLTSWDYGQLPDSLKELKAFQEINEASYMLNDFLDANILEQLKQYFFQRNSIYIIDNGAGMNLDTIISHWMEIGTGNKEYQYVSGNGRVKTGAKGIGRFALDRLGHKTEMWTVPEVQDEDGKGYHWSMDWRQFDKPNTLLSDITSNLNVVDVDLNSFLKPMFEDSRISTYLNKIAFRHGTILKISSLKDFWNKSNLSVIYRNLEALVPPKELKIPFVVHFFSPQLPNEYGKVETAYFDDYDGKIIARYDANTFLINIEIERNELDIKRVKNEFSHLFKDKAAPYDLKTLEKKKFHISKSVFDLLHISKNSDSEKRLFKLGSFDFTFYFLKNLISQKEGYPYKTINSRERKALIEKFGGIKIYRDSFRVRPYGDPENDWLRLGERAGSSTAGAGQRIGDWKIGANQIAGIITISRVNNSDLTDKSDRGAIIENDTFFLLQNVVKEVINEFELDRTKILNPFYKERKLREKNKREEQIKAEAEKLADQIVKERTRIDEQHQGSIQTLSRGIEIEKERKAVQKIIQQSFDSNQFNDDKETEISQIRTLASLGLIVTSFSHELQGIKNNANEIVNLERIYMQMEPKDKSDGLLYKDGIDILALLKKDTELMTHWIEYALTSVKKNKRKRTILRLEDYIPSLLSTWKKVFVRRGIEVNFQNNINQEYDFRAFEIDMNTIFGNLISNSIDSFQMMKIIRDRKIKFDLSWEGGILKVIYSDNGPGLPEVFMNDKESIFLPFTTSKRDRLGNEIGTGLGMYLVKGVVEDNNGEIAILETTEGFAVSIEFQTRN